MLTIFLVSKNFSGSRALLLVSFPLFDELIVAFNELDPEMMIVPFDKIVVYCDVVLLLLEVDVVVVFFVVFVV